MASIVAGYLADDFPVDDLEVISEQITETNDPNPIPTKRPVNPALLSGMAPDTHLVSLKVLADDATSTMMAVMAALRYVRDLNGDNDKVTRIHGVNVSLGYEFDPQWFACGQSPLCVEVDRLVRTGVVVVVAAGNTGYGEVQFAERSTSAGIAMTINDPGNADRAITVGSTHRGSPHTYGVSFFSSKGPTGDGRLKPDLVAPGERITSATQGATPRRPPRGLCPTNPVPAWRRRTYRAPSPRSSPARPSSSGARRGQEDLRGGGDLPRPRADVSGWRPGRRDARTSIRLSDKESHRARFAVADPVRRRRRRQRRPGAAVAR